MVKKEREGGEVAKRGDLKDFFFFFVGFGFFFFFPFVIELLLLVES